MFYFTRNHVRNPFKIISAAEIISATLHTLENIHELQKPCGIISKYFLAKVLSRDVDEGRSNYEIILFHM